MLLLTGITARVFHCSIGQRKLLLAFCFMVGGIVSAQNNKHYLNLDLSGGMHSLGYSLQSGTTNPFLGLGVSASYSYFFNSNWGVNAGLEIQSLGDYATLNYLSTLTDVDTDGDTYEFRSDFKNWREKQHVLLLEIPIKAQYRYPLQKKLDLLATAGFKIGIPVAANYKSFEGQIVNTGYYDQWNVVLSDMPQHGFSTIANSYSGNLKLKAAFMGLVEVGGLYQLKPGLKLYSGLYLNYGLNILAAGNKPIYQPDGVYNGILASDLVRNTCPLAVGIKVGASWELDKLFKSKPGHSSRTSPARRQANSGLAHSVKVEKKEPAPVVAPVKTEEPRQVATAKPEVKTPDTQSNKAPEVKAQPVQSVAEILRNTAAERKAIAEKATAEKADKAEKPGAGSKPEASAKPEKVEKPKVEMLHADVTQLKSVNLIDKPIKGSSFFEPNFKQTIDSLGEAIILRIAFEPGKSMLTKESYKYIDKFVEWIKENPGYVVVLQGHADSEGSQEVNQAISESRAATIGNYLVRKKVDPERVKTIGFSNFKPIATNDTPDGRSRNRRVEILIAKTK
ncbi:MAG TPA: OmpA family protein [Paludibacter sp.]|nr:OmpA family protein [Paludibacter sp.]